MSNLQELIKNNTLNNRLSSFLDKYGISGLEAALTTYESMQQTYTVKTKNTISRIHISDINYIIIDGHHMKIFSSNNVYEKYGSLAQEMKELSAYDFIKCSQNCIVSMNKIKRIDQNNIILYDDTIIHMTRKYAPPILAKFLT